MATGEQSQLVELVRDSKNKAVINLFGKHCRRIYLKWDRINRDYVIAYLNVSKLTRAN